MKKTRILANKLTIFIFSFLIAYSCFFYVPIEALARAEYSSSFENWGSTSESGLRFYTISRSLDKFSLSDVDDDKFYFVRLKTSVEFDSTQALEFRIPYVSVGDSLAWIGANKNDVMSYTDSSTKDLVFLGSDLKSGLDVSVKMYLFSETDLDFQFNGLVSIDVIWISELDENPLDSYNSGYDAGYEDGQEFGYSDGYSNGYSDGQSSGYESGFDAGVDSVDTDSYFMQGYEAGREVAYVEGFDDGYLQGYAEALSVDASNKTSLKAGDKQTYTVNKQLVLSELDEFNFNTFFPSLVVSEEYSDDSLYLEGGYGDSENWLNGEVDLEHVYSTFGYVNSVPEYVFTSSSEVYAYSVKFRHYFDASTTYQNVIEHRFLFGEETDIYSGEAFLTNKTNRGTETSSLFWIVNDYSVRDFYLSNLLRICTGFSGSNYRYASVDGWYKVVVEVTPYSKSEFNAAAAAVEKQTLEIKNQFNDLKHGFDTSSGDAFNEDFQASLIDYQVAENSLFQSATDGLSNFEFFDFQSVPAVVSGISFVSALMTSVFGAMGGIDGIGIILSVLFSVMLVSMVLGIYRFYQSNGKSNGKSSGKGGSKSGGSKGGKSS